MYIFGNKIIFGAVCLSLILLAGFAANLISRRVSIKLKIIDTPNGSSLKIQKRPTPLSGGIALMLTIIITAIFYYFFNKQISQNYMFFLAALGTTVSVGVLDDRFLLTARIRLIFYFLISALILIIFRDQLSLGIVAGIIITFLIGPGIITSVNMIDGMDGLCSTMSVISLLGFIALNYFAKLDNQTLILISISTILAIMPFLFLNFHPAKVFLGSSGSELLGVTLLALMLISTEGLSISYLPLRVLIIGLPVIDMIRVLYYRARAGRKLIFGDRTHIYDTLLQHGLNQRKVWSIMSLAQIAVVSIAVLLNIYL